MIPKRSQKQYLILKPSSYAVPVVVLWSTSCSRRLAGLLSGLQRGPEAMRRLPRGETWEEQFLAPCSRMALSAVFLGGDEKTQEIANGFKKGQGNFLDSSPLHTKRDNKITHSGALTKGSWNQRALFFHSHSYGVDGGVHHVCPLPAFWITRDLL